MLGVDQIAAGELSGLRVGPAASMIVPDHIKAVMQTLLVDMPFKAVAQPSIGLSLVKAAVTDAGWRCDILYANSIFAAVIGQEMYDNIMERFPPEMLVGDLLFAPLVRDDWPGIDAAVRQLSMRKGRRQLALASIPKRFWECVTDLQDAARAFVEEIVRALAHVPHDLIGLNVTYQTMPSLAVAKLLKEQAPEKLIILGGSHCEGEMGLALHRHYPWIDFVCRGEGERLLPQLLQRLDGGDDHFDGIPGLVWRRDGKSQWCGEAAESVGTMDQLPHPQYDDWLEQLNCVGLVENKRALWLPLETSRGCWWGQKQHCTFCGLNGRSLTFREKSPARVLFELQELKRYEIPNLFGVDLIFPFRYFTTLLPTLGERNLGYRMFFEVKANLNREQLQLLKKAGILALQPGIESLSTSVLKLMRKGISAYQNIRLLKWAMELGIDVDWNLLYGFPRETSADYEGVATIIRQLIHLRPPSSGCSRVRIDRFSPLHFDSAALGIRELQPAMPYEVVYGLPTSELSSLAYHFEALPEDDTSYIEPIAEEMEQWHRSVGRVSLTSLSVSDRLLLFDRRSSLEPDIQTLRGLHKSIYEECDVGKTLTEIASTLGASEGVVGAVLEDFCARGLVVYLDGRYLSIAVRMAEEIAVATPESLWPAVCHNLYVSRIMKFWRPLQKSLKVPDRFDRADLNGESSVRSMTATHIRSLLSLRASTNM